MKQNHSSIELVEKEGDGFFLQKLSDRNQYSQEKPVRLTNFTMNFAVVRAINDQSREPGFIDRVNSKRKDPNTEQATYYLVKIKSYADYSDLLAFIAHQTIISPEGFEAALENLGMVVHFIRRDRRGEEYAGLMLPYINREHWSDVLDYCWRGFLQKRKRPAGYLQDDRRSPDNQFFVSPEDFKWLSETKFVPVAVPAEIFSQRASDICRYLSEMGTRLVLDHIRNPSLN